MQEEKIEDKEKSTGELVPKHQKPKILLLDLPEKTLDIVRLAGFNAASGTLGTPYKAPVPYGNYLPVIPNGYLPEDYSEKEVIIIDLTAPEKRVAYPNGIGIKGYENFFWLQCKQDIIDPRLVQMKEARSNFDRILEHGGFFVIFAQPRFIQRLCQAKNGSINCSSLLSLDNWGFLSLLNYLSVNEDHGKEIYALDDDSGILQFFGINIKEDTYYTATLSKRSPSPYYNYTWIPILKNKFDQHIGGLIETKDSKGHILILPQMSNKPEFVLALLNEILPAISPKLFPDAESTNWIKSDDYGLDPVIELKAQKIEIQKKTKEEIEKLDKSIEDERNKFSFLYNILTSTNRELVVNVKKCLEFVGFEKVIDEDEEIKISDTNTQKQEDLQIRDKSPILLIEVKGLSGVPQENDVMQVLKYVLRGVKEWGSNVQGVFIVNHKRNLPPLNRGEAFSLQEKEDAKNNDIAILTSWDLFLLIKGAIEWGWDHKVIREVFYQVGRISCIPSIYKPLGKVFHYYDRIGVVEIAIENSEVQKGQRVGYITPTGYLEELVSSLRVNEQDVKKAVPGQNATIKTKYRKDLLHKGTAVYIISGTGGGK